MLTSPVITQRKRSRKATCQYKVHKYLAKIDCTGSKVNCGAVVEGPSFSESNGTDYV